jgi:hypothetical protein
MEEDMTPFIFDNGIYSINRDWVAKEARAIKRRYEEGYGVERDQWHKAHQAAMFRAKMETEIKQRLHDEQQSYRSWAINVGIAEIKRRMNNCDSYVARDVDEYWRLSSAAKFLEENGYA